MTCRYCYNPKSGSSCNSGKDFSKRGENDQLVKCKCWLRHDYQGNWLEAQMMLQNSRKNLSDIDMTTVHITHF